MKRVVIHLIVISFIILGCGGGSGAIKSEISQPLVTTNSNGDVVVRGKILLDSSGTADTTVSLSNIIFKSDENGTCILDYEPNINSTIDVTNGAEIDFQVTIDGFCQNIDTIIFEADKIIKQNINTTNGKKEKKKVEKYSKRITFNKIEIYNNFSIEIDSNIAQLGVTTPLNIRMIDTQGNEINDDDVVKVIVKSGDSGKLILFDDQNTSVSEIIYEKASYKKIYIKAKNGTKAKLTIQAILKHGNNYYKTMKDFDIEIQNIQSFSNQKYKINLITGKSFIVDSIEKLTLQIVSRENEEPIDDSNISEIKISTTHKLIKFSENNSGDKNDNYNKDIYTGKDKIIYVQTEKVSGLETLKINVILDINESYEENISKEFTIPIVSGPPNTISLIYVSSSYNNGLYSDKYRIHAVDKYGNPARVNSRIYVGAVSGLVKDANGNDIYVSTKGTIEKSSIGIIFKSNSISFENVAKKDTLIILANDTSMESSYLGGWIIKEKQDNNVLILEGDFNITKEDNLSFLVGNEKRFDPCEQQPKSVDFDSEDNTYELQEDGTTYFILRYPPYMVGKDVYLYANSYDEKRVGVSIRKKLFGTGITANSVTCANGGKCDKIIFTLNGSNAPLVDISFSSSSNFSYEGDCNYSGGEPSYTVYTECKGSIDLNIKDNGPNGESCIVTWDNSIPYEH